MCCLANAGGEGALGVASPRGRERFLLLPAEESTGERKEPEGTGGWILTYIHKYIHTCMHSQPFVYSHMIVSIIHTYIHTYMYIQIHTHTFIYTHILAPIIHTYIHKHNLYIIATTIGWPRSGQADSLIVWPLGSSRGGRHPG